MTNLLLFDNGFLRNLTDKTVDENQIQWQKQIVSIINDLFPVEFLVTPFLFLEFNAIEVPKKNTLDNVFDGLASENNINLIDKLDELIEYYSKVTSLSYRNLKDKINERFKNHVGNSPHAETILMETIIRFIKRENFLKQIYQTLAIDHLQFLLDQNPNNRMVQQLRMQLLRDLFGLISQGYNYSLIRLIRQVWIDIENANLPKGRKTHFKLKANGDRLDTEYLQYAVFGYYRMGKGFIPVTVMSCESFEKTIKKLKIIKAVSNTLIDDFLKTPLERANVKLDEFKYGKVIIFDKKSSNNTYEIDVSNLDDYIE